MKRLAAPLLIAPDGRSYPKSIFFIGETGTLIRAEPITQELHSVVYCNGLILPLHNEATWDVSKIVHLEEIQQRVSAAHPVASAWYVLEPFDWQQRCSMPGSRLKRLL